MWVDSGGRTDPHATALVLMFLSISVPGGNREVWRQLRSLQLGAEEPLIKNTLAEGGTLDIRSQIYSDFFYIYASIELI